MPVLIIAATYSLLFRGKGSGDADQASFLDPSALRARLKSKLPEGAAREAALRHADELVEVAASYGATTRDALERYVTHTASGDFSTESILEILAPADLSGAESVREVLRIRQAILEQLSAEEWQAVLG